jgi:hypothetical protein
VTRIFRVKIKNLTIIRVRSNSGHSTYTGVVYLISIVPFAELEIPVMEYLDFEKGDIIGRKGTTATHGDVATLTLHPKSILTPSFWGVNNASGRHIIMKANTDTPQIKFNTSLINIDISLISLLTPPLYHH